MRAARTAVDRRGSTHPAPPQTRRTRCIGTCGRDTAVFAPTRPALGAITYGDNSGRLARAAGTPFTRRVARALRRMSTQVAKKSPDVGGQRVRLFKRRKVSPTRKLRPPRHVVEARHVFLRRHRQFL